MFLEHGALELVLLAAVALIVVGPKDLPVLMRKVGQFTAKMRGMAAEFRASFDELARQSELDELRKEVDALRSGQHLAPIRQEIESHFTGDGSAMMNFGHPAMESQEPHGFTPPEPAPGTEPAAPVEDAPVEDAPVEIATAKPVRKRASKVAAIPTDVADDTVAAKPRRRAKPVPDAPVSGPEAVTDVGTEG